MKGPVYGGTVVTVYGYEFFNTRWLRCRFGTNPPVIGTWITSTEILCVSNPHGVGLVAVEVSNNNQDYTASNTAFTYEGACFSLSLHCLLSLFRICSCCDGNGVIAHNGTCSWRVSGHCDRHKLRGRQYMVQVRLDTRRCYLCIGHRAALHLASCDGHPNTTVGCSCGDHKQQRGLYLEQCQLLLQAYGFSSPVPFV